MPPDPDLTQSDIFLEAGWAQVFCSGFCSRRVGYPSHEVCFPLFPAFSLPGILYRLKRGSENMSAMLNQLNWRNDTRFIQLSGIFPVDPAVPLHDKVVNFSATAVVHQVRQSPRLGSGLSQPTETGCRVPEGCNERAYF